MELVAGGEGTETGQRERQLGREPSKPRSPEIPVPGRDPNPGSRILQRLVLQPLRTQPQLPPNREQALPVGAHEVRHGLTVEIVSMKPHAAVEGEAHPLAAACKLPEGTLYEQEMWPSMVAVPGGDALPEKR